MSNGESLASAAHSFISLMSGRAKEEQFLGGACSDGARRDGASSLASLSHHRLMHFLRGSGTSSVPRMAPPSRKSCFQS